MKLLLFAVPAVLIVTVFLFLLRYGAFSSISFEKGLAGGERVAYAEGRGDYRKSGELMDSIYEKLIKTEAMETYRGFGMYYDDPRRVPVEQLRYEAGCILDGQSETAVNRLENSFKIKRIKTGECVTVEFPYRGRLSVLLATVRVYPALSRYLRNHNLEQDGPVMEIYDVPRGRIIYRKYLL